MTLAQHWNFVLDTVSYRGIILIFISGGVMIHYLKNKVGVVDFANAQGVVIF